MTVTAIVGGFVALLTAGHVKPAVNADHRGLALRGYDAVAYVSDGQPLQGSARFELRWNQASWRFASAANRDAFVKDPEKYAPQFGGYCAWAVAHGYTAAGDPEAWRIVDGKLYLNYSRRVQRMWERDIPKFIGDAQANWPRELDSPSR